MQRLMQDTGIMKKILAMMLMLGVVAIITAGVNAWKITTIDARYAELVDNRLPAITQMVRSHRQTSEIVKNGLRATMYAPGSSAASAAAAALDRNLADAQTSFDTAVKLDRGLAAAVDTLRVQVIEVHRLVRSAVEANREGRREQAIADLATADAEVTRFGDNLKRGNDERIKAAEAEAKSLGESTHRNMVIALIVSILATGGALFLAHWVVKSSIVDPLLALNGQMTALAGGNHAMTIPHQDRTDEIGAMSRSLAVFRDQSEQRARLEAEKEKAQAEQEKVVARVGKHLDLLASGDLTAAIRDDFLPSYAQLQESFNSALASLGGLIRSVADSAAEIRTGSSEIAQASEDLARRTESNAASLEETSAAIQQMDGRLKASAVAASETVGRADQAIATVSGGRGLADEAVQAMGRVSESAKGIDSVIEGLDKIAFQTRVLAMNAAVEAGRAGEAGRGFAVVADLVSALAMRAEEEAKRARDQLTVTQTDIVTAVDAVGQVDSALQAISADVGEVHQLLASMASDNQAQALAITEINSAIASMDQATQQNAAMVEETSAASRNLMNEVSGLAEQAGRFRCEGGGGGQAGTGRVPALPRRGKEGGYQSPVRPLPSAAIPALTRPSDDDWKEF